MRITAQGHLIKLIVHATIAACNPPKSPRGKVYQFSAKSRKRLIEMFASFRAIDKAVFITLTYGQTWPDMIESKRHLKNFIQRIRDKYPNAAGVWRLEFQERGAPHYHLMLFNVPFWKKEDLARAWADTIGIEFSDWSQGYPKPPFTRIELIDNLKKAMGYVSKYIAKDGKNRGSDECGGFNYVPYQQKSEFTGRFWGILNDDKLPYATRYILDFDGRRVADTFRFMAHFEKKIIAAFGELGFTLFTDRLNDWMMLLGDLMGQDDFSLTIEKTN